jgi:hypothetical protein
LLRLHELSGGQGARVTGHSLGGGLSEQTALEYPSLVSEGITFQSAGISQWQAMMGHVMNHPDGPGELPQMTHYYAKEDVVHKAGSHLPGRNVEVDTHHMGPYGAHKSWLLNSSSWTAEEQEQHPGNDANLTGNARGLLAEVVPMLLPGGIHKAALDALGLDGAAETVNSVQDVLGKAARGGYHMDALDAVGGFVGGAWQGAVDDDHKESLETTGISGTSPFREASERLLRRQMQEGDTGDAELDQRLSQRISAAARRLAAEQADGSGSVAISVEDIHAATGIDKGVIHRLWR